MHSLTIIKLCTFINISEKSNKLLSRKGFTLRKKMQKPEISHDFCDIGDQEKNPAEQSSQGLKEL